MLNHETPTQPQTSPQIKNFLFQLKRISSEPLRRKYLISDIARTLNLTPEELMKIAISTTLEQMRQEKGILFHYHQIDTKRLVEAVSEGSLKSMEIQIAEGKQFTSTGTRPDVVQLTRDTYSQNDPPRLLSSGLGTAITLTDDQTVLVFSPEIMNVDGYNPTAYYPEAPIVPLNTGLVVACLNSNPATIDQQTKKKLVQSNQNIVFCTPTEWTQGDSNP